MIKYNHFVTESLVLHVFHSWFASCQEWNKLQNVAFWALVFEQKATDASFYEYIIIS